ncbi:ABC transporter ATP-binding protein uup [Abditibacteriota bacterium]|nr:ABC transporter ATP-binding protein uup [Abditibacteriota bacterium]
MALISFSDVSLRLGDAQLLDGAAFSLERGERVCLLGRNGEGKSSLLRVLSGELAPQAGTIALQKGVRLAMLPQEVPSGIEGRVRDVISASGRSEEFEIETLLSRLDLDGDALFQNLSGGLKRRAFLGRALAEQPDVLLLDEPTNHLDIDSIAWLEDFLVRHVKTLLFVSHDRAFLRRLATRIVELDRGQLRSFDCDYDTYLVRKEALLEAEETQRALFDKKLVEEEKWIRRGVEARRTKSLSRIRELMGMREERKQRRERGGPVELRAQEARKSGRLVVEAEKLAFSYPDHPIVENFSTVVMRGDKIGIIGPNGSGKTTLLRLLLGQLEPQGGDIKLGTNLQIAYFDQLRAQLDDEKSVQENVAGDASTVLWNGQHRHIVGFLSEFGFDSKRVRQKAGLLSGGERNRLLLAKLFTQPANLMVLDEPTNDLDIDTLDTLENLLVEFEGTILMVSHDRQFLNDVATSTLVFEPDASGKLVLNEYVGGFDDWQRQRPRIETVEAKPKPAPVTETTPAATAKPRKLGFKETRELEELPARIEKLEREQLKISEQMGDATFYQGDPQKVAQTTGRLSQIESELETAFARWEELLERA